MVSLKVEHGQQNDKLRKLEDGINRSDLVVHEIASSPNETALEPRTKVVTNIFESIFGMMCNSIARTHRLGRNARSRSVTRYSRFL